MRCAFMVWVIVAATIFISPWVNPQESMKILRPAGFPSLQRSPVRFAHDVHIETGGECHS